MLTQPAPSSGHRALTASKCTELHGRGREGGTGDAPLMISSALDHGAGPEKMPLIL